MKSSIFCIAILFFFSNTLLVSNTASAASFDCTKASSQVEKLICSDRELSDLDSKLGNIYRPKASASPSLVTDQKQWLRQQRNLCKTIDCLRAAYLKRIEDVNLSDECPYDRSSLIGGWVKTEGEGFEEMKLLSAEDVPNFLSWIHHRPEMTGRWRFENCTIHIQDLNENTLQFELEVQQLDGNRMYLRDMETDAVIGYERVGATK